MSIKEGAFQEFKQELLQLLEKHNLSLGLTGYGYSDVGVWEYDERDGYLMFDLEDKT